MVVAKGSRPFPLGSRPCSMPWTRHGQEIRARVKQAEKKINKRITSSQMEHSQQVHVKALHD